MTEQIITHPENQDWDKPKMSLEEIAKELRGLTSNIYMSAAVERELYRIADTITAHAQQVSENTKPTTELEDDGVGFVAACRVFDWQQVVLNGGPPCFHLDGSGICGRAKRWQGHDSMHKYIPLDQAILKHTAKKGTK